MNQPLLACSAYIRNPTALIHFERELSVIAQKVMTLIVAHCQKATKNAQGFYLIEKRQVCDALGWEASYNYLRVVEAFEEIYNNSLIWNLFGQDRTFKYLKCRLIVSLWVPEETGHYVGFQLHSELESAIQAPKVFGQILPETPALLTRSEYAFPLYELLADHVSREEGLLRIPLIDLKRYLGINGRYSAFPMFQARVLTPSLDSINTSTDLKVHYETWRTGRGIGGLLFHIQRSSKPAPALSAPIKTLTVLSVPPAEVLAEASRLPEEQVLIDRLVQQQHLREEDALHAVQTHGVEGVREILGYVRQEVGQRNGTPEEIRNVSAYLLRCFRDGYGRKGEIEREAERQAAVRQATPEAPRVQGQAPAQTAAQARGAAVKAWFAALPTAEQVALEQTFLQAEPLWAGRPANSTIRAKAFQRWLAEQGS